jgi:hypothetical protein
MIKKLIKYLLTLKPKKMSKHKDKKNEAPEVVETVVTTKNGIVETLVTESNGEVSQFLESEKTSEELLQDALEQPEFDGEKFSLDMMNAFISSTENLKVIKKQFNFDNEHFVSANIVENERLLKIIESLKPQQ